MLIQEIIEKYRKAIIQILETAAEYGFEGEEWQISPTGLAMGGGGVFIGQWLASRNINVISVDPTVIPTVPDSTRKR